MGRKITPFILGLALVLAVPALADWDPGDEHKMHYPQLPDPEGWDVCLVCQWITDDFTCSETGFIDDIHFWISWREDIEGIVPDNAWDISIWDDAGGMPGNLLWQFMGGTIVTRPYGQGQQGWVCPSPPLYLQHPDHINYYQVNVTNIEEPFEQTEGTTYWLVIKALIPEWPNPVCGWKTSVNDPPGPLYQAPALWSTDQLTWTPVDTGTVAPELHDMAFVITGGPHQDEMDFGDAPDDTVIPQYPTLLANNGARHVIVPTVYMGALIDAEPDGLPDPNALGDDNNNLDDEDGITNITALMPGQPASFDVTVSVDGYLNVWIDYDANDSWAEVDNQVFANYAVAAGTTTLNFVVPLTATVGANTFARFRYTTNNAIVLPYDGPASDGEVEDYEVYIDEPPPPFYPKWQQLPHEEGDGFDAASDLWLHEEEPGVKWEQLPNAELPGIHAHDYYQDPDIVQIILADDWLCEGGVVTDFHWWGAVENPGAGIARFHLSIHYNDPLPCLPMEPPYWQANIPITAITVTPTGIFNSAGLEIIRYDYDLPEAEWFYQEEGQRYWFDVSALSVDPYQPYIWLWQEHARVYPPGHILCPASQWINPSAPFWQWITWADDRYSDMAFRVTSKMLHHEVNKVVADDFISDGRPIEAVNWWGSYLDEYFMPYEPVEPYIIDGWIVSFHHESEENPTCPPDAIAGEDPTVLGLYFAPRDAVEIASMGYQDCLDHEVFKYFVKLEDCCLLCSETDPRNGEIPAEPDAFLEVCGFGYWLDIQAVVGGEWIPPDCIFNYTGHLPSDITEDGHFWGWHTSYEDKLEDACTGGIVDFTLDPTDCWDYGKWDKQQWECPWVGPPVNMSFELLTEAPCMDGDLDMDGDVDLNDHALFVNNCLLGPGVPYPLGLGCECGDFDKDGDIDLADWAGFQARFPYP